MRKFKGLLLFLVLGFIILTLTGCSRIGEEDIINASETFSKGELPLSLLETISGKEAIVIGQFRGVKEHQNWLADFVIHQFENNEISLVVLGDRHAYSWIFDSYVRNDLNSNLFVEEVISDWAVFLNRIKEYNNNLNNKKISVKTGDMNSQEDQFIISLQYMRQELSERDTVNRLLNRTISAANRKDVLLEFKDLLSNNSSNFDQSWGSDWNRLLIEMIDVELASIEIREMWDLDYREAHTLREELIKDLASDRLQSNGNTIFNYSFYHAQKEHYLGSRKQWLAEYLNSDESPVESSYSLLSLPMTGNIVGINNDIKDINIIENENDDLFKRTANIFGVDDYIYMDFNREIFRNKRVDLNLYYQKIEANPYEIFDGAILLPEATLIGY